MRLIALSLLVFCHFSYAQEFTIENISGPKDASFRGLSVVDDNVAWASGSKGWFGRTVDGKNWEFAQIKGHETLDFRALFAFDASRAILANAGSPAYILETIDGGKNWKTIYQNTHKDVFIDGVDFWNEKEGLMYGDPIDGRMFLLRTSDGGRSWIELPMDSRPKLEKGEASFAASGTGIRCVGKKSAMIATGGNYSRVWISDDGGQTWSDLSPPVIRGGTMTGIYSLAFKSEKEGIVVGGDYEKDSLSFNNIFLTNDGGRTWAPPDKPIRGLRECVEFITPSLLIATGLPGADISFDAGKTWQPLSDEKQIYVVRKARKGNLIMMSGGGGRLRKLAVRMK